MLRNGLGTLCILALAAQVLGAAYARESSAKAQHIGHADDLVPPNNVFTQYLYSVHDPECLNPVQTNSYFLGVCAPKEDSEDFVIHTCENAVLKERVFSDSDCNNFLFERVSFLTHGCTPAYEQLRHAGDGALSFSACLNPLNGVFDGNGTINSTCGITPTLTANQGCSVDQAHLRLLSAGFDDGNTGAALLNGQDVSGGDRGWHALCLDKNELTLKAAETFDLYTEPERNDAFLSFLLDECQAGDILVLYIVDDGSRNLSDDVKETLWVLYGATDLSKLQFRDSYILVSRKSQDGSKCSLNSEGFYEERICDVHPPTDVFETPAEVTRYTDVQCGQPYVQSTWPTDTCTGGADSSAVATCVDDGTQFTLYADSTCDIVANEATLSTDGCSFLNNVAYTSRCGASDDLEPATEPSQDSFVTDFKYYIEQVFTAHDTECEDAVQVDAWYLGVCAPATQDNRVYQLGCTEDGTLSNYTYEGSECIEDNLISIVVINFNDSGNATINGTGNGTLPDCDPDAFGFLRVGTCTNNNNLTFEAVLTLYPQSNCSTPYFQSSVEEETCIVSNKNTAYEAVCTSDELNIILGPAGDICSTPPIAEDTVSYRTGDCIPVEGDEEWPLIIDPTGFYKASCDGEEPDDGFRTDSPLYIQYVFDTDDDSCDTPVAANIWHLGVCTPTSDDQLVQYGCVDGVLSKYTYSADSACDDESLLTVEVVTETGDDNQCVVVNNAYRIEQVCTDELENFEDETSIALYGSECDTEPYFETIHKEGECVPVRSGLYLTTSCSNSNQELTIYTGQPSGGSCRRGFRAASADLNECDSIPNQVGQFLAYDDPVGNWFATCSRDELPGVDPSPSETEGGSQDAAPSARFGYSWVAAAFTLMLFFFARA